MPTVEDYFDDDTDIPLPAASGSKPRPLPHLGERGALLEEITDDDGDMDFERIAEQGRGVFGENSTAPPPRAPSGNGKGKMAQRDDDLRPSTSQSGPRIDPNTPMGGFMGDMMKLQADEEERLAKLRRQFGNAAVGGDPSLYKDWNSLYPIYFDAKASVNAGRRVPRSSAVWWPLATHIAQACSALGLPSILEPERCHPADWENPGRVKVQFEKDGRFVNPIVKNRTDLYRHLADQIRQRNPDLAFNPSTTPTRRHKAAAPTPATKAAPKKGKSKAKAAPKAKLPPPPPKLPARPPLPPTIPALDDRLPLHSPVVPAGVAVAAIKREKEQEKERKKNGQLEGAAPGEGKAPKVKKIMVRGGKR
ncbi:hypothetical protein L202_03469 [Cryptococcus amylolentus CBS 6039]|uniref:Signal recognition particle subunit SRP19 n=2 Tax=Cryptococcus amylolentus TaxID=104669 RepID=A0A1E3HT23_9TREE|nr:hypothetical protein L202_03469 [Cryptococcus amylolentus CBS 6039]ODN79500.1 hypothetical protein L202_03469 [Cryptococcus amylolentus CBS 6039]ODO07849.1 hypothetical protein I350_03429 [Cryptococcus amylolentus CBS 6273]